MSSSSLITSPSASTSPAVSSASTVPTSQQDGDPAIVRFTNVEDLFDSINRATGDFLIVTHVSPRHFTRIERERQKRRRKFRFRRYDSDTQILFITIPTGVHEALHLELNGIYLEELSRMGLSLRHAWSLIGAETFRQDHPGGNSGEGDSTGGPRPERSRGRWPTLVIEAGYSETLQELHNDMRWWFRASNHDVKIVILAKFYYQQRYILLERWEEENSYPQGAITRSRAAA
ncbi:uncharacterized protein P884DRAFT_230060, partial [Thermothelomyces heterothallicus CBS 202.75]|uniref:uncharacterized protein n=1 Tax=Thermothelomyces heterothallicus CBS 202.75 TaxID=1149848 RepID=UPI00374284CB